MCPHEIAGFRLTHSLRTGMASGNRYHFGFRVLGLGFEFWVRVSGFEMF